MNRVKVILVDDHNLVRAGIRGLIEATNCAEVVAETGDGRSLVELVALHSPDVVLLDVSLPGLNGLDALTRVKRESPSTKVLMLSMHANERYVVQALRAGASGYLLKDAAAEELQLSIAAVVSGKTYLSPAVSMVLIADLRDGHQVGAGPIGRLTVRHREVLQLIAEGKATKEIARILDVSVKTVEAHRAQLMQRLDIHDVAGLVRFAIRSGLIEANA